MTAASVPVSPTPPVQAAPAVMPRNGLGIAALCCGIVGILFGLIPFTFWAAGILGVLGIIFGAVGMRRVKRNEASNKGMALAGLITGVVAFGLAIWGAAILISATNQLNEDINQLNTDVNTAPAHFRIDQQRVDHQQHLLIRQGTYVWNQ